MEKATVKIICIFLAAAIVMGAAGGFVWFRVENKGNAPAAEVTGETAVQTTLSPSVPQVLTFTQPAKTYDAAEYGDVWKLYWEYIDGGALDKLLATQPEVQWYKQAMNAASDEKGNGFYMFDDIDKDGINELLICDGTYGMQMSDWRNILVLKYDPEQKEIRYCGGFFGFGLLQYLGEYGLFINAESDDTSGPAYYGYYAIEDYTLVKKFALATAGKTEDVATLMLATETYSVDKTAYFKDALPLDFQMELSEEDQAALKE